MLTLMLRISNVFVPVQPHTRYIKTKHAREHLESETDTHVSSVQIYTFRQTGVGEVNQLLL